MAAVAAESLLPLCSGYSESFNRRKSKAPTQAKPKAPFSFDLNHYIVIMIPHYSYSNMPLSPVWLKQLDVKEESMLWQAVGEGTPQGEHLQALCYLHRYFSTFISMGHGSMWPLSCLLVLFDYLLCDFGKIT